MSSAISTSTVTLNPAFLQEIKQVHEDLWQLLKEIRTVAESGAPPRRECACFAQQLGELRDKLAFHFTLEEAYGYFEDPAIAAPRLCRRAGQLRDEHADLYTSVCRLTERAEVLLYQGRLRNEFRKLACEVLAFDDQLRQHETRENELILDMYDDDIGVGD